MIHEENLSPTKDKWGSLAAYYLLAVLRDDRGWNGLARPRQRKDRPS